MSKVQAATATGMHESEQQKNNNNKYNNPEKNNNNKSNHSPQRVNKPLGYTYGGLRT